MPNSAEWEKLSLAEIQSLGRDLLQRQVRLRNAGPPPTSDPEGWLIALNSSDPDQRRLGAAELWQNSALTERGYLLPEVMLSLSAALADPDSKVRQYAALALGGCPEDPATSVPILAYLLDDDDRDVRNAAYESLENFNPESLPVFLQLLHSPRAYWRAKAAWTLGDGFDAQRPAVSPHLIRALRDPAASVRSRAAHGLAHLLGPKAVRWLVRLLRDENASVRKAALASFQGYIAERGAPAIPAILRCFRDPSKKVREQAAWTLYYIGQPAVPHLVECLKHRSPRYRAGAAESLSKFDALGAEVEQALIAATADVHPQVRQRVIQALQSHGGPNTIPALLPFLRRPDDPSFHCATHALASLQAKEAIPALLALVDHPTARQSALLALTRIGLEKETAIPLLVRLLREPDAVLRSQAMRELKDWKQEALPALPALIELLQDRGAADEWRTIAELLEEIGPAARDAVPCLLPLLQHEDEYLRGAAALALWKIDGTNVQVLAALTELLASGRLGEQDEGGLWDLCIAMGPLAKAGVPMLVANFPTSDWCGKGCLAEALAAIGPGASEAIPDLIALLSNRDCPLNTVVHALVAIGPAAVPALCEVLRKQDPLPREFAADALARIGPAAAPAMPLLLEQLCDEHAGVRNWAAVALAKIGREVTVIPILAEMLGDTNSYARQQAAEALGAIGPDAKGVLGQLQTAHDAEEEEEVQQAIAEAVARIAAT